MHLVGICKTGAGQHSLAQSFDFTSGADNQAEPVTEAGALVMFSPSLVVWIMSNFVGECVFPCYLLLIHSGPQTASRSVPKTMQLVTAFCMPSSAFKRRCVAAAKDLGALGRMLLCPQVVNLVFQAINVLSGDSRLSFVRLLAILVRMNVSFHAKRAAQLKKLMLSLKSSGNVHLSLAETISVGCSAANTVLASAGRTHAGCATRRGSQREEGA